jgi:hypothetical protein
MAISLSLGNRFNLSIVEMVCGPFINAVGGRSASASD